ncbi:MAG: hypothetical protein ABW123_19545, partial [Cystobacter sp.]
MSPWRSSPKAGHPTPTAEVSSTEQAVLVRRNRTRAPSHDDEKLKEIPTQAQSAKMDLLRTSAAHSLSTPLSQGTSG